jgi:hypothetical protein
LVPLLYLSSSSSSRLSVELPFYSKFLMIAAYLASYNPQKTDKRFFVKHHGKQRKTAQMVSSLFVIDVFHKGLRIIILFVYLSGRTWKLYGLWKYSGKYVFFLLISKSLFSLFLSSHSVPGLLNLPGYRRF